MNARGEAFVGLKDGIDGLGPRHDPPGQYNHHIIMSNFSKHLHAGYQSKKVLIMINLYPKS